MNFLINNQTTMKNVKRSLILFALVSFSVLVSCNPDNGGADKTAKEEITEALVSGGTWSADVSATNVSGVTGSPDAASFTVTFSETADGVAFTLGGDVSDYISGGSFSISEEGGISAGVVNTATGELDASLSSGPTLNSDFTQVSMTINVTEAGSRVGGIGTYQLVFMAGS